MVQPREYIGPEEADRRDIVTDVVPESDLDDREERSPTT